MQALHDVVQAGYVRYIGMSSCWAWQCTCFCVSGSPHYYLLPSLFIIVHAMQSKPAPIAHLHFRTMTLLLLLDYAINNKLTPFISMQNHYNLIYREEEREMFPTLKVRPSRFLFLRNKS